MRGLAAAAAVWLVLACWAGPARANGPVYVGENPAGQGGVHLQSWSGWVEMGIRGTRTRVGDTSLNETLLWPGLHLETAGQALHPDLLRFNLGGTLAFNRRWVSSDPGGTRTLAFHDFDLGMRLLPERRFHLNLFGQRTSGWQISPYRSSSRTENTAWGGELAADLRRLPTALTWSREEFFEDQFSSTRTTVRKRLRLGSRWRGDALRATLVARHENFTKDRQPQDYDTDGALLDAAWTTGPRLVLNGGARWLHRTGSLSHLEGDLHAGALVRPTAHLDGRAELRRRSLRPGTADAPRTLSHSGQAFLHHVLYGSLESRLNLQVVDENTERDGLTLGTLNRRSGELRLDYHRRTPWGRLQLGVMASRGRQERTGSAGERTVTNEPHLLTDGAATLLDQPDVIAGSVVVTDDGGFVVYVEGYDYLLGQRGDLTELILVPTGDIPDGATVRVAYRHLLPADLVFDILGRAWSMRFDGRQGWSAWLERQDTDQRRVSGTTPAGLDDRSRRAVGGRWASGPVTLEDEYEIQVVPGSRFRSNRLRADWRLATGRRWRLAGGAAHTWTRQDDPRLTHRYFQLQLRAALAASRRTTARLEAWARFDREDDSLDDTRYDLFGARVHLLRRWGKLTVEGSAAWNLSDRGQLDDRRLSFNLQLRRRF